MPSQNITFCQQLDLFLSKKCLRHGDFFIPLVLLPISFSLPPALGFEFCVRRELHTPSCSLNSCQSSGDEGCLYVSCLHTDWLLKSRIQVPALNSRKFWIVSPYCYPIFCLINPRAHIQATPNTNTPKPLYPTSSSTPQHTCGVFIGCRANVTTLKDSLKIYKIHKFPTLRELP